MNRTAWKWSIVAALSSLATLVGAAAILRHRPVLLHAFGDGCVCGDFHDKVTGIVLRNPFRDRSPENAANVFFRDLRSGKCFGARELCDYSLDHHRVSDWYLVNREDRTNSVALYFKLTKYGESDPWYRMTGEGAVELRKGVSGWQVTVYSSYF